MLFPGIIISLPPPLPLRQSCTADILDRISSYTSHLHRIPLNYTQDDLAELMMPELDEPKREDRTAEERMSIPNGSTYGISTFLELKTTDIELTTSEVDDIPTADGEIADDKITLTGSLYGFASLLSLKTTDIDLTTSGVHDPTTRNEKVEEEIVTELKDDPTPLDPPDNYGVKYIDPPRPLHSRRSKRLPVVPPPDPDQKAPPPNLDPLRCKIRVEFDPSRSGPDHTNPTTITSEALSKMSIDEIFGAYDTLGESYVYRPNMLHDAKWAIHGVKVALRQSTRSYEIALVYSASQRALWQETLQTQRAMLHEKSAALMTMKQTTIGYARALKIIADSQWSTIHGQWKLEPNEPEIQELVGHGVPSDFIESSVVKKMEGDERDAGTEKDKNDKKEEEVMAEKAQD